LNHLEYIRVSRAQVAQGSILPEVHTFICFVL